MRYVLVTSTIQQGKNWCVTAAEAGLGIFTSTYDAVGNRLTLLELDGSLVTYSYDASYQQNYEVRAYFKGKRPDQQGQKP